jgi:hypothetical protein
LHFRSPSIYTLVITGAHHPPKFNDRIVEDKVTSTKSSRCGHAVARGPGEDPLKGEESNPYKDHPR